jgi:hypothetical protein
MSRYHSNIEPSARTRGEYVGYCHGAWRIRRDPNGGWCASKQDSSSVWAHTLTELNAHFVKHNV